MSQFKNFLKDQVLQPYDQRRFDLVTGQVMQYDEQTNTATVYYDDPKNGGVVYAKRVPVELSGMGVISSGPFPGDQVWLQFGNGNHLKPKIVARADESYYTYTRQRTQHERQGAYYVDDGSYNAGASYSNVSLSDSWVATGTSSSPTNADYSNYSTNDFSRQVQNQAYYSAGEAGITHPNNNSTVKVKDDGSIDIFAATNCGLRINPTQRSISFNSSTETHATDNFKVYTTNSIKLDGGRHFEIKSQKLDTNTERHNVNTTRCDVNTTQLTTDATQITTKAKTTNYTTTNLTSKIKDANVGIDKVSGLVKVIDVKGDTYDTTYTNGAETVTTRNITGKTLDVVYDDINLKGHIEADLDHIIEDYLDRNFERYFEQGIFNKGLLKIMGMGAETGENSD